MQSLVGQQEKKNYSTNVIKASSSPVTKNNSVNTHISKVAADHDVRVSGTMIKVTYKKPSKNHLASPNCVNGIYFNDKSMPSTKNFMNSMKNLDAFMDDEKPSVERQASNKKSDNNCGSFTISKKQVPIFIGGSSGHALFNSTSLRDSGVVEKRKNEGINGISLLKKFETLKEISGLSGHVKSSSLTMKPRSPATHNISLPPKPIQMKAGTSEKFQGPPPTIKIPKGITIIRVKGSGMPKDDKILKKTVSEKIILPKEKRKVNISVKRKIPLGDSVVATKIIKKGESSQEIKNNKQLKNFSDITDLCETIINEDINENSMYNNNGGGKKEILRDDPELPQGWKRVVHTRYEGTPFAKHVVYIYSPQGRKFQFKWKLRRYLERIKSPLSAEQFHFGLYKKSKSSSVVLTKDAEDPTPLNTKTSMPKVQAPSTLSKNLIATKAKAFNLKYSTSVSRNLGKSRLRHSKIKEELTNKKGHPSSNIVSGALSVDKQSLLLYDPDLPLGWKRVINSRSPDGKLKVSIISPDGRIFRKKNKLHEYLTKHEFSLNPDRFYFGLYPKKHPLTLENKSEGKGPSDFKEDGEDSDPDNGEELTLSETDMSKFAHYATPMYHDPNLPDGWNRFIKIRACGRNAGKLEVVMISPDGKRIRSKGQLENYIQKNGLKFNADEFNFSVFGHPKKRPQSMEPKESMSIIKRRNTDRPVPDLDVNEIKETKITPEGEIINEVAGIMISCGLSSGRSERRLRIPRKEHEKNIRTYLNAENEVDLQEDVISPSWIQKLVKCRSDFRSLEHDAAKTIANSTKEFIKELSLRALQDSDNAEKGLLYDDVANVVDKYESLSYLKTLIPKKITYKEYVRLNRPKQFLSFT